MKTKQTWEFLGSWPCDGLTGEKATQAFKWQSFDYLIIGSIKGDGRPIFNVYQWDGGKGRYRLIEFGWSTLIQAKRFVDRYHAGLAPAIHQTV